MWYILGYLLLWLHISLSSLIEPTKIELFPEISYHLSIEYCKFSEPPYITTMNAHCYCLFNPTTQTSFNCSIPGPTFILHPGDQITWTWHNRLIGDGISDPVLLNKYRDLDITNIHTHGMHISPQEDDVLIRITPGSQQTYTYTVPTDHYPGLHWLHAHHHGSVSFQVASGMFSALLIQYTNINDFGDESLINMKENLLIFHEMYVITTDLCNCANITQWKTYFYYPPIFDVTDCISGKFCFRVFSMCYEYCSMPDGQRQKSGFIYNIQSNHADNFQLFLVNGQYAPIIDDIKLNTFRRLRFVNAITQYYIQYKFPITNCEWHIIAIDGIFLTDNQVRNINIFPYFGQYLLAPGGRLDVIVKCSVVGIYDIITSENNDIDPDLFYIGRVPTGIKLFQIQVNIDGIDTVTTIPVSYPQRPNYLKDLRLSNTESCGCNTYFDPTIDNTRFVTWTEQQCGFVFNMKNAHNVNGIVFDPNTPSTSIEYGKIYEFTLIPHMHPYHQHVNPFQLQQDVGINGFQAKAGDWYDTLGGTRNIQYTFKTYPIDFTGIQIIHCHFLPHEDIGMMTYINILQPHQICNATTGLIMDIPTKSPTHFPTIPPTNIPIISPTDPPLVVGITAHPSIPPSQNPTNSPSIFPSQNPTNGPSIFPSQNPSLSPSNIPTNNPTFIPSNTPTFLPTKNPTFIPSNTPTFKPTFMPTHAPSFAPTNTPSNSPSYSPTITPSYSPSNTPSNFPSFSPTNNPTKSPSYSPTNNPSNYPSYSPTITPTQNPTNNPTFHPTNDPTYNPTYNPTYYPTNNPTYNPTYYPTNNPTTYPTILPTFDPTKDPSTHPTNIPTTNPTADPTNDPTTEPTFEPTIEPTNEPSIQPSYNPTYIPTSNPSCIPSIKPTHVQILSDTTMDTDELDNNNNNKDGYGVLRINVDNHTIYIIIVVIGGGFLGLIIGLLLHYYVCKKLIWKTGNKKDSKRNKKDSKRNKRYKCVNKHSITVMDEIDEKEEEEESIDIEKNWMNDEDDFDDDLTDDETDEI